MVFNLENLILYLKARKRIIFILVTISTLLATFFIYYFKLNLYSAQVKFYITNSEAVDHNTILKKKFIDLSVEDKDLLRLQSFGYSNRLILGIIDSIQTNTAITDPELLDILSGEGSLNYIANLYEVEITKLDEIQVTVRHRDKDFAYYLCHQIMRRINKMNNEFLSEFKEEQIGATERQILLLNEEKKELLSKMNALSEKIKGTDYLASIRKFKEKVKSNSISNEEMQEFIVQYNSPEKLELDIAIQKISSLDERIEVLNRSLYNDRWSMDRLEKKKPYITQDKPAKNHFNWYSLSLAFLVALFNSSFLIVLVYALYFRYNKYIKLAIN